MQRVPTSEEIQAIAEPRERLTMAGARAVIDHAFEIFAAGVSPELVTNAAGRSRRVFYDHFDDKEDYLRALFGAVYDTGLHHLVTQASAEEVVALLQLAEGDLFEAVQRMAAVAFEGVLDSDADRMQIIGWAMAKDDPSIESMLRDYYRGVDAATMRIMEALLQAWGLELRSPWTAERVAAVLHAIGEGLYMRAAVDPDLADLELFELACLSIIPIVSAPSGTGPADVRQHLDEFAGSVADSWRRQATTPTDQAGYERVVASVRDQLRAGGFASLTLSAVARRCRLSPTLVERNFPTVAALLRTVVSDSMPTLQSEADFDLADGDISIRDALRRHLHRVGAWVQGNPDLAMAVMACGTSDPRDPERTTLALEVVREFSEPATSILVAGLARGELREDAAIVEIASMTTELMLGRGASMPGFAIETTAAFIESMVFDGAGATRAGGGVAH